jgi:hypothetical protein
MPTSTKLRIAQTTMSGRSPSFLRKGLSISPPDFTRDAARQDAVVLGIF